MWSTRSLRLLLLPLAGDWRSSVPPTGPLQGGEVAVDVALMLLGAFSLWRFNRIIYHQPPLWVAKKRGRASPLLSLPYGGTWLLIMGGVALLRNVDVLWLKGILSLIGIVCAVVFFVGWFIWFPWPLLPWWYRAAKRAGVDVRDPFAVQAFRELSKPNRQAASARQRRAAAARRRDAARRR